MTSPIAVEAASGAQLLPTSVHAPRQQLNEWHVHLACNADHRRHPEWRSIAERIIITYPDGEHHDHQ